MSHHNIAKETTNSSFIASHDAWCWQCHIHIHPHVDMALAVRHNLTTTHGHNPLNLNHNTTSSPPTPSPLSDLALLQESFSRGDAARVCRLELVLADLSGLSCLGRGGFTSLTGELW
jgi:hypothetical protein